MLAEVQDFTVVGTLEITDKVLVTDPCYDLGTWCTATVIIPKGTYTCCVHKEGYIVTEIRIVKDNITDVILDDELNSCGVDSGQLGIFNYNKYGKGVTLDDLKKSLEQDFLHDEWEREFESTDTENDKFYKVCCNHTLNKNRCGIIDGVGFVSSSGYGDGTYAPYLLRDKYTNKVVGISVKFCYDDEE